MEPVLITESRNMLHLGHVGNTDFLDKDFRRGLDEKARDMSIGVRFDSQPLSADSIRLRPAGDWCAIDGNSRVDGNLIGVDDEPSLVLAHPLRLLVFMEHQVEKVISRGVCIRFVDIGRITDTVKGRFEIAGRLHEQAGQLRRGVANGAEDAVVSGADINAVCTVLPRHPGRESGIGMPAADKGPAPCAEGHSAGQTCKVCQQQRRRSSTSPLDLLSELPREVGYRGFRKVPFIRVVGCWAGM